MDLLLAEELTLLAYDDESGKTGISSYLSHGLGGAVLADLALRGKVTVDDRKVAVADPAPTGDPLLDGALTDIVASRPRRPVTWVSKLGRGKTETVLDRLVGKGLLRREEGRILLVFPTTVYPAADPRPEREIRDRLLRAVREARPPVGGAGAAPDLLAQRTIALAVLAHACGMDRQVFPDVPKRQLGDTLKAMTEGDWAGKATVQAIAAVRAAVLSATTTAATSAATS